VSAEIAIKQRGNKMSKRTLQTVTHAAAAKCEGRRRRRSRFASVYFISLSHSYSQHCIIYNSREPARAHREEYYMYYMCVSAFCACVNIHILGARIHHQQVSWQINCVFCRLVISSSYEQGISGDALYQGKFFVPLQ
jgi:hypothetical protein